MESIFVIDDFVNVQPGEPYRLLPFGPLVKDGKMRNITPEFASKFKLPKWKAPIKLGSHDDETAAGGHIIRLFIGPDGLYGETELTPKGTKAFAEGDYRYHSPEIVWSGGLEDPVSGVIIEGPFIVGDALLHTPHLGEAAALYEYQPTKEGENTMTEVVQVPNKLFDKFMSLLTPDVPEEPKEKDEPVVEVEEHEALKSERDDYKAKVDSMEADKELEEKMSAIEAEFDTEEYGTAFIELGKAEDSAKVLASMDDEQRSWVMTNFKAFSKQIDEGALIKEVGTGGEGIDEDNPLGQLNAIVFAKSKEKDITYLEALELVTAEQPDLVASAYPKKEIK